MYNFLHIYILALSFPQIEFSCYESDDAQTCFLVSETRDKMCDSVDFEAIGTVWQAGRHS